jgi:hypothetical protein
LNVKKSYAFNERRELQEENESESDVETRYESHTFVEHRDLIGSSGNMDDAVPTAPWLHIVNLFSGIMS